MRSFALTLLLVGCHSTKPAPGDLDGLAHWYWSAYDGVDTEEGADSEVIAATLNLDAALGGDAADAPSSGTLSDMTADEQALVFLDPARDITLAAGMFITNVLPCTMDQIERITIEIDQAGLYPGTYDTYERAYTSDADAYLARETPYLTWTSSIDATVLGASYHEDIEGGTRFVPDTDGEGFGDMLLTRVWLPTPAEFESDDKSFDQDYQLEIYYPLSSTEVVHYYVLWRQMDYGGGLDTDDASVQGLMIGALLDWDKANADLCEGGF
jgi:hypothetical protein